MNFRLYYVEDESTEWIERFRRCGCRRAEPLTIHAGVKAYPDLIECGVCGAVWMYCMDDRLNYFGSRDETGYLVEFAVATAEEPK